MEALDGESRLPGSVSKWPPWGGAAVWPRGRQASGQRRWTPVLAESDVPRASPLRHEHERRSVSHGSRKPLAGESFMRIVYGVHGYGWGHATRALGVLPDLMRPHEVLVLAG